MWDTTELSLIAANMQAGYWGHGGWSWMNGFHWLTWLLLIALAAAILIAAFSWATRDVISNANVRRPARCRRRSNGRDDLDDRFARGEINRAVYLEKRRVLS